MADDAPLILVGLPGAGKSTVGRLVAKRLGRPFVDLDLEIERRAGMSVAALFATRGEAYFRGLEVELTGELRASPRIVLAPGGGWATNEGVMALLRPPGSIIYLAVSPATAIRRLGAGRGSRPLLQRPDPVAELTRLLAAREARYLEADLVLDTERLTMREVVDAVAALASGPRLF